MKILRVLRELLVRLLGLHAVEPGTVEAPFIAARPRGLPWVHSTVRVTRDTWHNWSRTLVSRPDRLYSDHAGGPYRSPRTLDDLCAIVRDARALGKTVRVFGSSHSWSRLVPTEGFLVDNRMIGAEKGRFITRLEPPIPGRRKARATVPPGITSRELELWLWDMGYSLAASSVEDCFTVGGMVATATHGAGLNVPSTSDMVVGMTFVDGRGNVRRWTRETATPDELAAIQCGLGSLGLIYDITLEVEPRYEVLFTMKTVPYEELFADTPAARARMKTLHEENYSVEFFWWPFKFSGIPFLSSPRLNPEVWVLTASKQIPAGARRRSALRRWIHMQLLDVPTMFMNGHFQRVLTASPRLVGYLPLALCATNVWVSLRSGAYRMPSYDANHYVNATGVEFVLVTACEWSIPFQPGADAQAADGIERVRKSFAVLHDHVEAAFNEHGLPDPRGAPVNIAVEMRTIAPSQAWISPQYLPEESPTTRFAVPEIVTTAHHPAWPDFLRKVHHAIVGDTASFGRDVRNHLAKEWRDLPHAQDAAGTAHFLRERCRSTHAWERFLAVRQDVDPDGIFLNDFLREWFELDQAAQTSSRAA
jgi:FAD/FMN-containing dehydrogenase